MDPLHQNDDSTRFLESLFKMLLKEINNFQKTTVPAAKQSTYATDFENFTDHLVFSNNKNSQLPEYVLREYSQLLQDFQELETTMIPSYQKDSMYVQNSNDSYLPRTGPKSTIEKNKSENLPTWALNHSSSSGNTTHLMGVSTADRSITMTVSAAAYNTSSWSGISSKGEMFTALVKDPTVPSCGLISSRGLSLIGNSFIGNGLTSGISRMDSWRQVGANEKPKRRPKRKRRYRGVYQTEAEAILKQELLKIKQRATSAEAYQKKKAYISHLEEQVDKLHEQNKRLKYSLMFLGSNPVANLPQEPLKKTISGPT